MAKNLTLKRYKEHPQDVNMNKIIKKGSIVDPKVYAVARDLLKRYKSAFIELAKK